MNNRNLEVINSKGCLEYLYHRYSRHLTETSAQNFLLQCQQLGHDIERVIPEHNVHLDINTTGMEDAVVIVNEDNAGGMNLEIPQANITNGINAMINNLQNLINTLDLQNLDIDGNEEGRDVNNNADGQDNNDNAVPFEVNNNADGQDNNVNAGRDVNNNADGQDNNVNAVAFEVNNGATFDVVFLIRCQCGAEYIGETEAIIETRIDELTTGNSAVKRHLELNRDQPGGCGFDRNSFEILSRTSNATLRRFQKALHVESRNPNNILNSKNRVLKVFPRQNTNQN